MLGYIGRRKKLAFQLVLSLVPLMLIVAAYARAQTQSPRSTARPKRPRNKASKKQSPEQAFVLVGAGDIASCKNPEGARATAKLIEQIPGTVFAAGDLAYEKGSAEDFKNCYDPAWGRFKERTKPALGNHEYEEPTASGYFQYWGAQAGPAGKGYYSFDLGEWHIVVMNTNCSAQGLGGCDQGSPQETWLKEDLAKHPNACVLAYGHHALFSSGFFKKHAVHPELKQLWEDLYAAHADLVLAGHEHSKSCFSSGCTACFLKKPLLKSAWWPYASTQALGCFARSSFSHLSCGEPLSQPPRPGALQLVFITAMCHSPRSKL